MMRTVKAFVFSSCAGLLAFATVAAVSAQSLQDPTRPPASLGHGNEGAAESQVVAAPVLQSVLISPTRRVAIINGRTVQQGDKVGDARVVRIMEGAVVLRSETETQTLKLFPNVEKQRLPGKPGEGRGASGDNKGR